MACHLIFIFITNPRTWTILPQFVCSETVSSGRASRNKNRNEPSYQPVITTASNLSLAAGGPDVLQVAVTLSEAVEGVIALTAGTDEATQSVGLVLAGVAAVLVNLADGQLDRGVVVGLDDAVGGAALAGHVAIARLLAFCTR